jgi:hypothetical protein
MKNDGRRSRTARAAVAAFSLWALTIACATSEPPPSSGSGGSVGSGGAAGAGAGGSATGGSSGAIGTGGVSTGGGGGAAAGGAAGHPNGGAGNAGGSVGVATGCAGKTYKLCEDFESGAAGAVPTGWTKLNGYGANASTGAGLATDAAHSGAMSLKSDSSVTGQGRVQKSLSGLGATATKHWGRLFYRVQSPAVKPTSGVIHITFASLEGSTEDRIVDTVENTAGKHQWLFNIPDDSCCTGSSYDWSFDAGWHCAEWYVDQSSQTYRFFSDGTEVTSIGFTNRSGAKMSNWTSIAVGTIFYQTPPAPIVVWFDDLAIDDNQVGCQ